MARGPAARWLLAPGPIGPCASKGHHRATTQSRFSSGEPSARALVAVSPLPSSFSFRLISPTFWLNTADSLWIPKGGSWVGGCEGGRGEGNDCMPRCELFNCWNAFWIPFGALETENEWFATCNVSKNSGFGLNTFDVQIKLFEVGLLLCACHEK